MFPPPVNLGWIIADILQVLVILIIVDFVRSWLYVAGVRNTSDYTPWVKVLHTITEPVLIPFRALWNAIINGLSRNFRVSTWALRRIDLSPMFAIIAIQIVQGVLTRTGRAY